MARVGILLGFRGTVLFLLLLDVWLNVNSLKTFAFKQKNERNLFLDTEKKKKHIRGVPWFLASDAHSTTPSKAKDL